MALLILYLKKHWRLVFLALLLAAVNQIFSLLDPAIFRYIIDNYATKFHQYTITQFVHGVTLLLAAAVGVAFVSRVAKNFQDYYVNVVTQQTGAELYADGVERSLSMPYAVFEDQRSGETLGKLQKVRSDVERFITAFVNILFTSTIGVIFVTVYALRVDWIIAPAFLATVPILGGISSVLSRRIKLIQKTIFAETAALAGSTTESLRNIELVKTLGLARQEVNRLNATTGKILKLELKKVRYLRSLSFLQGTAVNLLRTSILFMMLYLIFTQRITVGQFFSLFIYSFFIFGPLQELGNIINVYRETEASLNNLQEILRLPPEPKPLNALPLGNLESLEFDQVSFQHRTANRPAVSDVTFRLSRGETVAFVGPSGAGKTTLVKLLVGLYPPESGVVRYNSIDRELIDPDELRSQIGFVTQDTQLFSGTIRENLLFVRPNATDAECLEVLHRAAADSLLARADKGLDTLIGEGGVKVSGGEKQRLSIARALLRKPRLLVFDEATSSLDSITEEEITRTIRDVGERADVMTILIAHRLSTVLHAERIYVLERGHIVEQGTHAELVAEMGLYYALWRQQIGERLPAPSPAPSSSTNWRRYRNELNAPTDIQSASHSPPRQVSFNKEPSVAKVTQPYAVQAYRPSVHRDDALTPEIVDPRIADVEALARWLDYAFSLPGGFRFGLAGIVGLIPGIGDVLDGLVSLYIVIRAIQLGISRVAIARMLVNVGIEALAGSVPFIGDLFDVAFKANRRNYQILKSHLLRPRRQSAYDWLFLILTVLLVLASILLPVMGLIEIAKHI